MKTAHTTINGQSTALALTNLLIIKSQWFKVEPLPDDNWKITVKIENTHLLEQIPQPRPVKSIKQLTSLLPPGTTIQWILLKNLAILELATDGHIKITGIQNGLLTSQPTATGINALIQAMADNIKPKEQA